jgi:GcrA cell cycle regulator
VTWTPEKDEVLQALMNDGLSFRQIAPIFSERFGETYTRNAVLSRAQRQGFKITSGVIKPHGARQKRYVEPKPKPPAKPRIILQPMNVVTPSSMRKVAAPQLAKPPTRRAAVEASDNMPTLAMLGAHACRWPIGTPPRWQCEHQRFCGEARDAGEVYCPEHRRLSRRAA